MRNLTIRNLDELTLQRAVDRGRMLIRATGVARTRYWDHHTEAEMDDRLELRKEEDEEEEDLDEDEEDEDDDDFDDDDDDLDDDDDDEDDLDEDD